MSPRSLFGLASAYLGYIQLFKTLFFLGILLLNIFFKSDKPMEIRPNKSLLIKTPCSLVTLILLKHA